MSSPFLFCCVLHYTIRCSSLPPLSALIRKPADVFYCLNGCCVVTFSFFNSRSRLFFIPANEIFSSSANSGRLNPFTKRASRSHFSCAVNWFTSSHSGNSSITVSSAFSLTPLSVQLPRSFLLVSRSEGKDDERF